MGADQAFREAKSSLMLILTPCALILDSISKGFVLHSERDICLSRALVLCALRLIAKLSSLVPKLLGAAQTVHSPVFSGRGAN